MTSIFRKLTGLMAVMACLVVPSNAQGWEWGDNNWNCCNDNCCFADNCCVEDCCCGPLNEGRWGITVKGGVTPSHWTHRATIYAVNPTVDPDAVVFPIGTAPKFNDIFDLPWQVGGELNYNLSCNAQLFIEANYLNASGKKNHWRWYDERPAHSHFDDFEAWNAYLGARYFFDRCWLCNRVAPFVGFKAGFVNHREVHRTLYIDDVQADRSVFHHGRSGVSAGLQIGFDTQIWDCVFATLNFEFVASQPHRNNANIHIDERNVLGGPTNFIVGPYGTEISFPITLGLRYEF